MLAVLTALSGITSATLCCKKTRKKIWKFFILFFLKFKFLYFSTKKFSILAGALSDCKTKQVRSKKAMWINVYVATEMITIQKSIVER